MHLRVVTCTHTYTHSHLHTLTLTHSHAHIHPQGEALQELLELAQLRLARGAVGQADEGQVAVFAAVTALLGALQQLDTAPGMRVCGCVCLHLFICFFAPGRTAAAGHGTRYACVWLCVSASVYLFLCSWVQCSSWTRHQVCVCVWLCVSASAYLFLCSWVQCSSWTRHQVCVCVCACVCVCVCVCIFVFVFALLGALQQLDTAPGMRVCVWLCVSVSVYLFLRSQVLCSSWTLIQVRMCVRVQLCVYLMIMCSWLPACSWTHPLGMHMCLCIGLCVCVPMCVYCVCA